MFEVTAGSGKRKGLTLAIKSRDKEICVRSSILETNFSLINERITFYMTLILNFTCDLLRIHEIDK